MKNRWLCWGALAVCLSLSETLLAVPPMEVAKLRLNVGTLEPSRLENLKASPATSFDDAKSYVIQLDGPITPERRDTLGRAGIKLGEYLPDYAYIVDLHGVTPATLTAMAFVTWVGEFRDEWKLDPELGLRAHPTPERQAMAARDEIAVVVSLFEHHGAAKVLEAMGRLAGATLHTVHDEGGTLIVSATVRRADLRAIAGWRDVHYVEEAPEITLRNATSSWIVQSNVSGNTPIWAHGIIGAGQVAGHMDGKININHCAFFDPVNNTPGPSHRKIVAYNETLGADPHGTHTADTAAGEDFNGSTGNLRGMAYGAKIAHSGVPSFTDAGFYDAATTLFGQGARAFTNSWGDDGTTSYNSLCRGVDRFSYDNEDALVMFAVTNTPALKNPENAKNLLAVGASQDTPSQGNFCSGGAGPTADGRRKPEIYAPGCNTTSAASGTTCGTTTMTGTSMASPVITGVGLLVREYYMDGFYPSGAATPANAFTPSGALIKATLLNSAVDMTGIAGFPSNQEGWGRLLADNALYFSGDARKLVVLADTRNANGLSTGQQQQYTVTVQSAAQSLKVTGVWTDPPASASTGTASAAINDLDLEVVAPDATLYLGNNFSGGVSVSGGTKDAKNNVEMVLINSPAAGAWTVRLKAAAVNSGAQGFALVVAGDVSNLGPAPTVTSTIPATGASGRTLSSVGVYGTNFQVYGGATTVKLAKTGQPDIIATSVGVPDSSTIGCNIDLTLAEAGNWDVVVINPDSQSGTLPGGFLVTVSCTPGDMNGDGFVDGNDIQTLLSLLVNGGATPVQRCAGDLDPNHDGVIDLSDVDPFVNCVLAGGCP